MYHLQHPEQTDTNMTDFISILADTPQANQNTNFTFTKNASVAWQREVAESREQLIKNDTSTKQATCVGLSEKSLLPSSHTPIDFNGILSALGAC